MLKFTGFLCCLFVLHTHIAKAQEPEALVGWWDLSITRDGKTVPGWLEVEKSGVATLVGRAMVYVGSARPISEIEFRDGHFWFTLPPQWIGPGDLQVSGILEAGKLTGSMVAPNGVSMAFTGTPAPLLLTPEPERWSRPRSLIGENSLDGWQTLPEGVTNQWQVSDGILSSPESGANLRTAETFSDFKLHVEFRIPEGSNSGIYLRGRYEVQVIDSYGKVPNSHEMGGVYGLLLPNENAGRPAGTWQTYDITLVGRRVTVVLNGKTVISRQIIPGVTGGALDSDEAAPGPILLQGDHGPVEYRNMTVSVPADRN